MKTKQTLFMHVLLSTIGTLALMSGILLEPINHYILGLLLIVCAIGLYLIMVYNNDRNWLDIRAVFSGVWLGTIGLASLRLLAYQEPWQAKTWLWVAIAYAVFQIGANLGIFLSQKLRATISSFGDRLHIGRLQFKMQPNRLFVVCIVTTIIGIITFIINVLVRGYIPAFSPDPHAYVTFYSKVQIFSVAATAISGLCYYVIRTQNISKPKAGILYLCILYHTFLYPILIASRGTFLASAISLMVVIFYLHKKKFTALLLSLVVIFSVYIGCSYLRNYTNNQLVSFFEPSQITLPGSSNTTPDEDYPSDFAPITSFSLPPRVAWIYSYLTVSHDNFNEAVQNTDSFTYGTRQLSPINVILRIPAIEEANAQAETHLVREHLTTNNLIGDFYYDFGGFGIVLCMLFWSFLFGLNQGTAYKAENWVSLLLLGNTMVPIMLCFFASWTSVFTQWMLWGTVFLFAIASCIKYSPKQVQDK